MAKKKYERDDPETSIPAGVYPELDRDLGREGPMGPIPSVNLGLWPSAASTPFPLGIFPVSDSDLSRDGGKSDPEGGWPDIFD